MLLWVNHIWIGVDDTDSVKGGCTTYVARALINQVIQNGYDIIGYPRLVRLNPNIPWKTRGNGALAFRIGRGKGKPMNIGEVNGLDLIAYRQPKNDDEQVDDSSLKKLVTKTVQRYAQLDDENTNPGFVLLPEQPDRSWYTKTVQEIVRIQDVTAYLNSVGAMYKQYKNGRGIIGATAAISWTSTRDRTYELITYRKKARWGTKRRVNDASVKKMDTICPTTFDNYDYLNRHNRLVPNSPCPILYGIRGENPRDLVSALSLVISESRDGWLLFETNQGSDDHLQKKHISEVHPYHSVIITGSVKTTPRTLVGGHVIFQLRDSTGVIDCAAYEPTKQFRSIIRGLTVGDCISVYGGIRKKPLTINIEKIKVHRLAPLLKKVENPVCPVCGKHMKSRGTCQGYKCRRCGTFSEKPRSILQPRLVMKGFYEVPVCARRHLSKPLKRMK
ncbi:MAG: tRNA(Ile)(2)-agmatinylcytidine synthase [Methanobacteriota archaeon]